MKIAMIPGMLNRSRFLHSRLIGSPSLALLALAAVLPISARAAPPLAISGEIGVREACTSSTRSTNLCLEASFQYRCLNYGRFSLVDSAPIRACNAAVTDLVRILDIVQVDVSGIEPNPDDLVEKSGLKLKQVLFEKDIRVLFRRFDLASYFEAALLALQESVRFGHANNLWDAIYQKSNGDRELTLKIIAQGAQDVSFGMWHLNYLDKIYRDSGLSKNTIQRKNLDAAGELTVLFQENLEHGISFSAYPSMGGVETSLHPYLHHFYLPAYLASVLKRDGHSVESSFFTAFLLNTGYEFVKLDAKVGAQRWPFSDPARFDAKAYELQARKIYTGYVGALWGLGLEARAKSYEVFSRELAANPYEAMRGHFNSRFK